MSQNPSEGVPSGYGAVDVPGVDSSVYGLAVEDCPKRVRVYFDDECIADSQNVMLMHETDHPPVYYFPVEDVKKQYLEESGHTTNCPHKGEARYWHADLDGTIHEDVAWSYVNPNEGFSRIANKVAFFNRKVELILDGSHYGTGD